MYMRLLFYLLHFQSLQGEKVCDFIFARLVVAVEEDAGVYQICRRIGFDQGQNLLIKLMAIGPFDQLDKGNAAVARQQHTVVRLYTPGDQAEQKSIIAVLRPGALIHEQIAQQPDALLYLQDVAHGNAHVYNAAPHKSGG